MMALGVAVTHELILLWWLEGAMLEARGVSGATAIRSAARLLDLTGTATRVARIPAIRGLILVDDTINGDKEGAKKNEAPQTTTETQTLHRNG
jgi:hypothetical protein